MHMLLRLSLIVLLLGSTSSKLLKKNKGKSSKKLTNKNKKFLKKDTGYIEHEDGTYIGVKYAAKSKNELTHSQAQAKCQSLFGTSLATILDATDQAEIEELLGDSDWGNAVNKVWVGFKKMRDQTEDGMNWGNAVTADKQFAWEPCSTCYEGYDCSADDEYKDNWHGRSYILLEGDIDDVVNEKCGVLLRGSKANLGKWGLNHCSAKREFICNAPGGRYETLAFDECLSPSDPCDAALNIAFLLDESINGLDLDAVNGFVEGIVESDINDASFVSVVEFSGKDWLTYRQTVDFTTDKDTVISALQNNEDDVTFDDFNSIVVTDYSDVVDQAMSESNVVIVFSDGNSEDILSADYPEGVYVMFVLYYNNGVGNVDLSATFPNMVALAGQNVFKVEPSTLASEVEPYIEEAVCVSSTSSAWSVYGAMFGDTLSVDGRASFVG
eukprot:254396_1